MQNCENKAKFVPLFIFKVKAFSFRDAPWLLITGSAYVPCWEPVTGSHSAHLPLTSTFQYPARSIRLTISRNHYVYQTSWHTCKMNNDQLELCYCVPQQWWADCKLTTVENRQPTPPNWSLFLSRVNTDWCSLQDTQFVMFTTFNKQMINC